MSESRGAVAESKEAENSHPTADFKSGQKYPTPSPGAGDRVFYETLLQQRPESEMAQDWCLAYGVLSEAKARQVISQISSRRNGKGRTAPSPAKASKPAPAPAKASNPIKRKALVLDDDNIVGDTGKYLYDVMSSLVIYITLLSNFAGMDSGTAWEGRGTTGI